MTTQTKIFYRGWIIEEETEAWPLYYNLKFRYYRPDDEHIHHASTLEEAKDEIWEKVMTSTPEHIVVLNGRQYPFAWIEDAIKFAVQWNAEEFHPAVTL